MKILMKTAEYQRKAATGTLMKVYSELDEGACR